MRQTLERHLHEKIVPFWNRLVDREHGGFYGYVGLDLALDATADKGAVKMARILWSYAALENAYPNDGHLMYAETAYEYIVSKLWDDVDGGVFWKTAYDGRVINDAKHVYAHSFMIYALAELYLATRRQDVLDRALALFALLEEKAYDADTGAYWEQFDRRWQKAPNTFLAIGECVPVYTTNAVIHLIEAYTTLYRASREPDVKTRLSTLLSCFYERIYCSRQKGCGVLFDRHWNSLLDSVSFGHDIEASWLIDEALDVLRIENGPYAAMTKEMAQRCFKRSYRDGRIISERTNGKDDEAMIWWVQTEAIVGFYNLFEKTKKRRYLRASMRTIEKTLTHIADAREGGEWFWSVDKKGVPHEDRGISENWKANYHNVRACLEIIKRGSQT